MVLEKKRIKTRKRTKEEESRVLALKRGNREKMRREYTLSRCASAVAFK